VQLNNIDKSVRPGDNFFLYANGAWVQRTVIPADRVSINGFSEVADEKLFLPPGQRIHIW
jgi:predicted metalloendopeptidase